MSAAAAAFGRPYAVLDGNFDSQLQLNQFEQQADLEIQALEFGGVGEGDGVVAGIAGMNVQREQGVQVDQIGTLQLAAFNFVGQFRQFAPRQRQATGKNQAGDGWVGGDGGHGGAAKG